MRNNFCERILDNTIFHTISLNRLYYRNPHKKVYFCLYYFERNDGYDIIRNIVLNSITNAFNM